MELPNYSKQLMQQLRALRKEGQFCDCTILVGDSPHQAHKLVLAASSLLFRSLLEGSDSISIDTTVVSTQEFSCLLDMVYTGKLPPGKHNFTRIIAAADSLQMFDVAVGCKNILTSLMKQSTTASPLTTSVTIQPHIKKLQNRGAEVTTSNRKIVPSVGKDGLTISPSGAQVKREVQKVDEGGGLVEGDNKEDPQEEMVEKYEVSACKRPRLQLPKCTEGSGDSILSPAKMTSSNEPVEERAKPRVTAADGTGSSILLEASLELLALLTEIPSITELLDQAARTRLGEQEREVVSKCCEIGDPGLSVERLLEKAKEGALSEVGLIAVLHAVQETAPAPYPRLMQLLEGREARDSAPNSKGSEAEGPEDKPHSSSPADNHTKGEDEVREDKAEHEEGVGEDDKEETAEDKEVERKSKAKASSPYSCRWCSKTFAYKCRLLAHAKSCSQNQEAKQRCPQCPEVLPTARALQRHSAQAHPEAARVKRKVVCDLCGRTFAHPSGMLYHKRTEHFEEKPFACEECGAKFAANSSLKNHMRLHTGEKPYHCKHCDMSFSVAAALAYHTKKKHSEGKMYLCQYCEAVFAQSIELTRHVRTHTGDKPYVCRECGKGFSQANGLSVHLQTFHNITEPHDCQKCRLSFPSLEEHRKHIQECHPKEFHQCHLCLKTFGSAALLDKHRASHTGSKPFSCQICDKSYQQLSGLWYHNRTTHPEVFAGQSHKQLKTLVQCSDCLRFFPSTGSLAKHQRADHPGIIDADGVVIERADIPADPGLVKCPYCLALFPSEEEAQEHASSQHFSQEGAAFGCSLCPLVCPSQLQLQEHFLSCHMGALENEEEASTSQTAIQNEDQDDNIEQVTSLDQLPLSGSQQQVFVALGDGEDGQSPTEVVAVNMEDLLNGSVAFICGDGQ